MTIPVSTVPAVQSYLLSEIESQLLLAGEQAALVVVGDGGTNAPPDLIEIAKEIRRKVDPFALVGSGEQFELYETYEMDIVVSCAMETVNADQGPQYLAERTWTFLSYVETVVRTDPSLGGLVVVAYPVQSLGGSPVWADNNVGRICEITLPLHVEATL